MVVAGPSKSGTTHFVKKLVENRHWIFPPPEKIIWCYREWQPAYESLQDPSQVFTQYSRRRREISSWFQYSSLVNIWRYDMRQSHRVYCRLVNSQSSSYRNTSVIHITQNVFDRANQYRTIRLNAHYLVLFKNPRDKYQVTVLSRQFNMPHLMSAY